ncbi:MAG: hypothetical protein ACFHVJ_09270 [Aestuariibacter sp.]
MIVKNLIIASLAKKKRLHKLMIEDKDNHRLIFNREQLKVEVFAISTMQYMMIQGALVSSIQEMMPGVLSSLTITKLNNYNYVLCRSKNIVNNSEVAMIRALNFKLCHFHLQ